MAFSSVGSLGATSDKTAGTSIALTTTATAEAGNLVVVIVAKDNAASADGNTSEVTSITDSAGGNTWTKAREFCNSQGGANSGATVAIYYSVLTNAISSGGTITANFSDSRTASAISAWEFTKGSGTTIEIAGTNDLASDGAAQPADQTISGLASGEYLWFRGGAREHDGTGAADSAGNSFTLITYGQTSGGGAASNMAVRGHFKISTATSETASVSGTASNADMAHMFVALKEVAGGVTLACDSGSFSWTGTDANLERSLLLTSESGTFTWTGQDATLTKAIILASESGSFGWVGQDVSLFYNRVLASELGSFSWTGTDANLERSLILSSESGNFAWTGQDVNLQKAILLAAESGSFTWSVPSVGFVIVVPAGFGSYTWVGQDATLTTSGGGPPANGKGRFNTTMLMISGGV